MLVYKLFSVGTLFLVSIWQLPGHVLAGGDPLGYVEDDSASDRGTGMKGCTNDKPGSQRDYGCPFRRPLCHDDMCYRCMRDTIGVSAKDTGCPTWRFPICGAKMGEHGRRCIKCVSDAWGSDVDSGCTTSAPLCGSNYDGKKRRCYKCINDHHGDGIKDTGCPDHKPVCDAPFKKYGKKCDSCESDAYGSDVDFGCTEEKPLCASKSGIDQCFACINDHVDDGITDTGCEDAAPFCDGPSFGDFANSCSSVEP